MAKPIRYTLIDITARRPRFRVTAHFADGQTVDVGQIEHRFFRHLHRPNTPRSEATFWQATASDGSHRAVHETVWQAAVACDSEGYPFPISSHFKDLVWA